MYKIKARTSDTFQSTEKKGMDPNCATILWAALDVGCCLGAKGVLLRILSQVTVLQKPRSCCMHLHAYIHTYMYMNIIHI